jgi:hypothetical protein
MARYISSAIKHVQTQYPRIKKQTKNFEMKGWPYSPVFLVHGVYSERFSSPTPKTDEDGQPFI